MQRILTILLFICVCITGFAQRDLKIKTVFVNMPDSILPFLTKVNRADCIDFLECNMKAEVKNRFGSVSEMTILTDDFLAMTFSPESSMELKLLPLTDTTKVICMIRTVCGKACDSRIIFYSTDWKELKGNTYLDNYPVKGDFISDTIPSILADSLNEEGETGFHERADICLLKASFSPENPLLYFEYTTPDYMETKDAKRLRSLLKDDNKICYEWKGDKFVRIAKQN